MFKVTEQGIERSIPTLDEPLVAYQVVIPKEIFIEAYNKYILSKENDVK